MSEWTLASEDENERQRARDAIRPLIGAATERALTALRKAGLRIVDVDDLASTQRRLNDEHGTCGGSECPCAGCSRCRPFRSPKGHTVDSCGCAECRTIVAARTP